MFSAQVYSTRRNALRKEMTSGIVLLPGNQEVALNYPANTYAFRQDSNFSYFFGLENPDFAGLIDLDEGTEILFGNDIDLDDIIWMGKQPTVKELGLLAGVSRTQPLGNLSEYLQKALSQGRKIHILPPYRGETILQLAGLLNIPAGEVRSAASPDLIRANVKLRMVKEPVEIEEISRMIDVAYEMHTTAMKMAKPGVIEQEIAGTMEGIALAKAAGVSFPIIFSVNGQTLHNHHHNNILSLGRMIVSDAGCESETHYASDITRTFPVGGKFSKRQQEIYEVVLKANLTAIEAVKPGVPFKEVHMLASTVLAEGLTALGIMKGDPKEAVRNGAHTLFFPHGLGHPLGLDVHDLEGMGENFVGYDDEVERSKEFGLAFLRFGRRLKPGFVMTIEPGIYFIPELIDLWKSEKKHPGFINYDLVETYKDFGGVRIEDDVLVTETGHRVLGKPIPKTVREVEDMMK